MANSSSAGRKLSVAIIARDAEATIAAALESVRSIADEIIVVDTGSTDHTRQIARQRASRVVEFPWCDDFSAARNYALEQLSGNWVLWLDATEQLDPDSAKAIRRQIDILPDSQSAYLILVQLPPDSGQTDGEQVARIRLWPLRADLKYTGRVREERSPTLNAAGLKQELTTWRILRSPRDILPQNRVAKARRNIRIAELEIAAGHQRLPLFLALGEAWAALREPLKAAGWFRRAIDQSPAPSPEQLEAYYGLLTTFDSRPNARDEQIAACLEALKVFPLDAQLLCAMGSYMQAQGRIDLASRSYQAAVEHGQINQEVWHLPNLADVATVCYTLTLELQSRPDEARAVLENALRSRPNSEQLRQQLIDLHIKHNRRQEALAELDRFPTPVIHREALRTAVRGACLAAEQQWPAALPYLRKAYDAGCRHIICLRWLASCLIAAGDNAAAEPILLHWQAAAPAHPEPRRLLAMISPHVAEIDSPAIPLGASFGGKPWRVDGSSEPATVTVQPATKSAQKSF